MKFKKEKLKIAIILIIISLLINVVQFAKMRDNEKQQYNTADNEFMISLQLICYGIEDIETKRYDEVVRMAMLASGTSKANTIYTLTSYYKSNPLLGDAIWILNDNITNKTNIREVLDKNDLNVLIPVIEKIIKNPLDETATKELHYLIRKHTVIGSSLP